MSLATLTYILTLLTITSVILGFVGYVRGWWESPERKEERARQRSMADALLGTVDVKDRQGGIIEKGSPGLVSRVATLEDAVKILVNQDTRISAVEARVSEHDAAIAALIATTFEKGAGHALAAEEMKQRGVVDGEVE